MQIDIFDPIEIDSFYMDMEEPEGKGAFDQEEEPEEIIDKTE
jgi:hypothetical protein